MRPSLKRWYPFGQTACHTIGLTGQVTAEEQERHNLTAEQAEWLRRMRSNYLPGDTIGKRGLYVGDFTRPKGVAVDRFGHLYVVESFYDHLLVFDEQGRFLMPIGGTGKRPGEVYLPAGVWTDDRDRVYVADMFNGRVAMFQYLGGDE